MSKLASNGLTTAPTPYKPCSIPSSSLELAISPIQAFHPESATPFAIPPTASDKTRIGYGGCREATINVKRWQKEWMQATPDDQVLHESRGSRWRQACSHRLGTRTKVKPPCKIYYSTTRSVFDQLDFFHLSLDLGTYVWYKWLLFVSLNEWIDPFQLVSTYSVCSITCSHNQKGPIYR